MLGCLATTTCSRTSISNKRKQRGSWAGRGGLERPVLPDADAETPRRLSDRPSRPHPILLEHHWKRRYGRKPSETVRARPNALTSQGSEGMLPRTIASSHEVPGED